MGVMGGLADTYTHHRVKERACSGHTAQLSYSMAHMHNESANSWLEVRGLNVYHGSVPGLSIRITRERRVTDALNPGGYVSSSSKYSSLFFRGKLDIISIFLPFSPESHFFSWSGPI